MLINFLEAPVLALILAYFTKYIAGEGGENLRDIAQRFGVRLSAIKRMNHLTEEYVPLEGDTIRLR